LRVVGGSIREMVGETVESWKDKGSRGDGSQSWLSWENSGEEGVGRMSSKKPTMYAVARNGSRCPVLASIRNSKNV
jgi:hypothetical protein